MTLGTKPQAGDGRPRRRDAEGTRAKLLEVARDLFARYGYDRTTVRDIASGAGVAPNLVTRYFGGKPGLFRAATSLDLGVRDILPGPHAGLGARIAANVVHRWEQRAGDDPLVMMIRSAGGSDRAAEQMTDFFAEQASRPLADHLRRAGVDGVPERVAACGALIMGVVTSRYVLRRGPVAQAAGADLERWLGEALQRLLDGPVLPGLGDGA